MTIRMLVLCCTALSFVLQSANIRADEPKKSYYVIGNSLTWDTVPSRLDGDVQWHVDCGVSLPHIRKNPDKPCVKSSTLWPTALKEKQYDVISVQPFYGSTLKEDVAVISEWLELQPKAVIVIHTGWARSATRAQEYADDSKPTKMSHSPAYITALLTALKKQHPDRTFRSTHAQDLLAKIAADVSAKKAPIEDVTDLYRDAIHMKIDSGRYLMHNAMRRALGQPTSAKGFEKMDPKLKTYFDSVLASLDE